MKKRTSAIAAGVLALVLGLSACSSGDKPAGGTSSGADNAFSNINEQPYSALKQGGELNASIGEFTEQKNQWHMDGTVDTWTLWDLYNPELIKFKPNGDLNVNKNYLTSVNAELVDGNQVVTYEINPKAQFNDGTPIDAAAFKHTWESTNGSNKDYNPSSTDGWNKITSVEPGKDDREVVVTYDGAWPWWGGQFNTLLHPACADADCFNTGYLGSDLASAHPEWGAGPYKLESFDANVGAAVFVPNDKWWGDAPRLDKITLTQREAVADINATNNGEVDTSINFTAADSYNQIKDAPGTETRRGANSATYMLQLNVTSPVLKDTAVRHAIMVGIDRTQLDQVRFEGLNYTEPFPGSLLLFTYQDGYVDNFSQAVPETGADAAKKILEDAGYTMGDDGYYAKDGEKLHVSLTIFSDSQANKAQAQVVQQMLKNIGVEMEVVQKAGSDFSDVMASGDWEMNISGFSSSDPFGVAYTCQIWCSPSDDNYSGLNKSGAGTPELDAEIHAMEALPTADEQIAAANKLEVKEFQQYGLMPLYNGPYMFQVKTGLANVGSGVFAGKSSPFSDFWENIGWVA